MKSFRYGFRQCGHVLYDIVVFCYRHCNAGGVYFLKTVVAEHLKGSVSRDCDKGNTVGKRVGDSCNEIGCAGTRRRNAHARFARRAGVTFCHKHRASFVRGQKMTDFAVVAQSVVKGQNTVSGISENGIRTVADEFAY